MNMKLSFDTNEYGCARVDMKTGLLHVGNESFPLSRRTGNLGNALLAASFINLAHQDPARASLRTMANLTGTSTNSFTSRLRGLRKHLDTFEIADGISAASLFLSDRLTGNQNTTYDEGLEKLPFHLNTALIDAIGNYGFYLKSENLIGIRTETYTVLGAVQDPSSYQAALGALGSGNSIYPDVQAASRSGFQDPKGSEPKYPARMPSRTYPSVLPPSASRKYTRSGP